MITGFVRLGIVVVLLVWMGTAIYQWWVLDDDIWRVEGHISPFLRGDMSDFMPSPTDWPVYAATPDFLALSENERVREAAKFFEAHVSFWEYAYFLGHNDALKQWMISTARLGTDEAPVQYWRVESLEIPYRQFNPPGIAIAPRLRYVFFNETVVALTALISTAILIVLILATVVIRWVYRGFAKK